VAAVGAPGAHDLKIGTVSALLDALRADGSFIQAKIQFMLQQ